MTTPSQQLQRVVVRMLYDPQLVLAVYANPSVALADLALDDRMLGWLTAPDRRAWTVDRERRSRSLAALIEEYPLVTAMFGARDAFMSSAIFHRCVQAGEPLAVAYGDYLAETLGAGAETWPLSIERAMAALRRPMDCVDSDSGASDGSEGYRLASDWACVRTWDGAMEAYGAEASATGTKGVKVWQPLGESADSFILVNHTAQAGMDMSGASEPLGLLLLAARTGASLDTLVDVAAHFECDRPETQELLDELVADGLLVRCNA